MTNENDRGGEVTAERGIERRGRLMLRCANALASALRQRHGPAAFGADGKLRDWRLGLVDGVDEASLQQAERVGGDQLREAHATATLVLNSFARWRADLNHLRLAGVGSFDALRFDARCPTGTRGTPPPLDVLAASGDAIVAVVARTLEYLSARRIRVADAYLRVSAPPGVDAWVEVLAQARDASRPQPGPDVVALARHALALARTFPGKRIVLLYLYWEPLDAARFAVFAEHREALDDLMRVVAGDRVTLRAQSFAEPGQNGTLGASRPGFRGCWLGYGRGTVSLLPLDRYSALARAMTEGRRRAASEARPAGGCGTGNRWPKCGRPITTGRRFAVTRTERPRCSTPCRGCCATRWTMRQRWRPI